ncbi:MAG: dihydrodipicolinate synthase family protein [Candidatus Arcticimaribacter sp.]|nr:dihydrodipicolinate synthase family protein [Flavobacteriaceae bacterium]PSR10360.1 MAG: dihydrodipicolinate synthase family protein [Candidatus Arcticimaribacter sp.]PTM00999.1 MAG: dihydrodipicolinate synthase family protein [Candidatus Arcticimaribacter sp.]
MNFNWQGVMPALTTQFDAQEQLNLEAFELNLVAQIEAGVHGIVLGGTLGEASTLTASEKVLLLKKAQDVISGRIPVIINIAEQSTGDAIAAAQAAEANGADGLMLLPPMRYKATDEETVQYFAAIAKSTKLPIMIYNNPVDYKIEVTLDMFDELQQYKNIQAVKESTRDISNVTRMINRFGSRYQILCGVDTLAMESLVMGADGWVAGLVDAFPRETVAIFAYTKAGKIDEALIIYRWFLPLLELDISPQLVQNIKQCEIATGIGTGHVRKPRLILKGAERIRVQKIIDDSLATRPDLGNYKTYL